MLHDPLLHLDHWNGKAPRRHPTGTFGPVTSGTRPARSDMAYVHSPNPGLLTSGTRPARSDWLTFSPLSVAQWCRLTENSGPVTSDTHQARLDMAYFHFPVKFRTGHHWYTSGPLSYGLRSLPCQLRSGAAPLRTPDQLDNASPTLPVTLHSQFSFLAQNLQVYYSLQYCHLLQSVYMAHALRRISKSTSILQSTVLSFVTECVYGSRAETHLPSSKSTSILQSTVLSFVTECVYGSRAETHVLRYLQFSFLAGDLQVYYSLQYCHLLQSVYMAHALRRMSYATCDNTQPSTVLSFVTECVYGSRAETHLLRYLFSFLARDLQGYYNLQYCHFYRLEIYNDTIVYSTVICYRVCIWLTRRDASPTLSLEIYNDTIVYSTVICYRVCIWLTRRDASPTLPSVYMAHALRRISYATCDPTHCQFSFLAREPKGHFSLQYCHSFVTKTAEQAFPHCLSLLAGLLGTGLARAGL
ncbi:SH2 domain containing 5 [Homalodisca vitripennis]|nr:SH2 domain containing 5 [Homalodisca vitripennis]